MMTGFYGTVIISTVSRYRFLLLSPFNFRNFGQNIELETADLNLFIFYTNPISRVQEALACPLFAKKKKHFDGILSPEGAQSKILKKNSKVSSTNKDSNEGLSLQLFI